MGMRSEELSVEAEIAECCREMYATSDLSVAMRNWSRLRELTAQRNEKEFRDYSGPACAPRSTAADRAN